MGKVVDIENHRKETTQTGQAFCLNCKHEWVAVASAGTTALECPSCRTMKGLFRFACERECLHWVCNCGNEYFKVTEDGYYCVNCGAWQYGF